MESEILIIDDSNIVTMLHQATLERSKIKNTVKILDDDDTTLEYLESHPNHHNTKFLFLLDINMPVMNAWDLLDEIQNKSYVDNCIVIIVSSSVDQSDKDKSFTYKQVVDYIEKPFLPVHVERLKEMEETKNLLRF